MTTACAAADRGLPAAAATWPGRWSCSATWRPARPGLDASPAGRGARAAGTIRPRPPPADGRVHRVPATVADRHARHGPPTWATHSVLGIPPPAALQPGAHHRPRPRNTVEQARHRGIRRCRARKETRQRAADHETSRWNRPESWKRCTGSGVGDPVPAPPPGSPRTWQARSWWWSNRCKRKRCDSDQWNPTIVPVHGAGRLRPGFDRGPAFGRPRFTAIGSPTASRSRWRRDLPADSLGRPGPIVLAPLLRRQRHLDGATGKTRSKRSSTQRLDVDEREPAAALERSEGSSWAPIRPFHTPAGRHRGVTYIDREAFVDFAPIVERRHAVGRSAAAVRPAAFAGTPSGPPGGRRCRAGTCSARAGDPPSLQTSWRGASTQHREYLASHVSFVSAARAHQLISGLELGHARRTPPR